MPMSRCGGRHGRREKKNREAVITFSLCLVFKGKREAFHFKIDLVKFKLIFSMMLRSGTINRQEGLPEQQPNELSFVSFAKTKL